MPSDNLKLWNSLETTDPKYTKRFNRGGFKGDAINGAWILKRLTETFGPCGVGWRLIIDKEDYVSGHFLSDKSSTGLVHVIRGRLVYRVAGETEWVSTGEQYGQTTMVGENKNGIFFDEEAPKKSVTDCLAKCACLIGLGADIHLGMFDDNKYVETPQLPNYGLPETKPAKPAAPSLEDDIATCDTMMSLACYLDAAPLLPEYNNPARWEVVCKAVAKRFREIDEVGETPAEGRTAVLDALKSERARLDSETTSDKVDESLVAYAEKLGVDTGDGPAKPKRARKTPAKKAA